MRTWIATITLCMSACAASAAESTRHAFSHATEDPCVIAEIREDAETKIIVSAKLECQDGDITYFKQRAVGNTEANWPTLAWDSAKAGDFVTCKLEHHPFGRNFFVVVRTFKNCARNVRQEAEAK